MTDLKESKKAVESMILPVTLFSRRSQRRRQHRGRRAGVRNRLRTRAHRPPLPSILLANVQSLENKLDDIRARTRYQRDIRDCNIFCLTETWLTSSVPDHAITPAESFSVFRTDRTAESGKLRGGGVCFMVNNRWCNPWNITVLSRSCSPHLELLTILCRPFYLPREFTAVIISAIYIPPQADNNKALSDLHDVLSGHQAKHPDAALIVAGDFNRAKLKQVMPNFHQHVTCPTRGNNTLDHCYSPFKGGYKAISLPAFGKSDHVAILLAPEYKQRLHQEAPATLQDALGDVDWDVFQDTSANIDEFADTAISFIGMLVDTIIPSATIRIFPNQKSWVDSTVRRALKARTTAYKNGLTLGDMTSYKAASYGLRKTVKAAKRRYKDNVESHFQHGDSRRIWDGLRKITDYKPSTVRCMKPELADDLNAFFARFEVPAVAAIQSSAPAPAAEPAPLILSEHDVRRALRATNCRKAAGPDSIPGTCAKSMCRSADHSFH
ncbi:uncharacterized protein LOC120747010 [Simochromis diagramma]|uniref:uncharacterized protein LOC120747010 n=1 Tax=Simochromis diagramma TaxID=43689 RepID=UPI001A7EBCB2|nr:uncharacterized protein LOC120747010 [Simochromis diagramma]